MWPAKQSAEAAAILCSDQQQLLCCPFAGKRTQATSMNHSSVSDTCLRSLFAQSVQRVTNLHVRTRLRSSCTSESDSAKLSQPKLSHTGITMSLLAEVSSV